MKSFVGLISLIVLMTACGQTDNPLQDSGKKTRLSDEEYQTLLSLNDMSLTRRALNGDLGMCTLSSASRLTCSDQPAYTIFLKDEKRYYPSMAIDPPLDNIYCQIEVGHYLHSALEDGFCFFNSTGPVK